MTPISNKTDLDYLEEELETLVVFRGYLQKKIERLRHQLRYEREKLSQSAGKVDRSLWIPTNCITPYVIQYLKGDSVSNLARDSAVSIKTITNIVNAETEFTSDRIAEAILLAMDLPHIYSDLIPVRLKKVGKQIAVPEPPFTHYEEP